MVFELYGFELFDAKSNTSSTCVVHNFRIALIDIF